MFVSDSYPNANVLVEFLNGVTGWNYTMDDVFKTGERILDIRHCFNIREGLNLLKYKSPDRIIGIPPLKTGPTAGRTVDEKTIDSEFCEAMSWDVKTSKPSKRRLIELGMVDVAEELYDVG